jgi:hypothetical protein
MLRQAEVTPLHDNLLAGSDLIINSPTTRASDRGEASG